MTEKTIRRLKIENFKSIDSLEVKELAPFSVFAVGQEQFLCGTGLCQHPFKETREDRFQNV